MRRVLVTGAGGAPALNFTRSLRRAPLPVALVGTDSSRFHLFRSETDERYLVPRADEPDYLDELNSIIEREEIDFVHAQNDVELRVLSGVRDRLAAPMFLPRHRSVMVCQDKFASQTCWIAAGLPVPATYLIDDEAALRAAFDACGGAVWLRATTGAGGRGSLPVHDIETATAWLRLQNGWGTFTASELLTEDSVTWMSLWRDGELVVAQGRRRLYWELGKVAPSGVSGATGGGVTVSDPVVDEIATKAVLAIDDRPHGLWGVDLTYASDGVPNLTEINIGRFFTTHLFFTELGLNLPHLFVAMALGDDLPPVPRVLNPLPDGMVWIRGLDLEPVLTSMDEIERCVADLDARRGARS
jgi:carbamoyl-phosphate synthase large subunit